jgi:hypothetical protein
MNHKIILKRNGDNYLVDENDLLWLLRCTYDILNQDLKNSDDLAVQRLLELNIQKVTEAQEFIENEIDSF